MDRIELQYRTGRLDTVDIAIDCVTLSFQFAASQPNMGFLQYLYENEYKYIDKFRERPSYRKYYLFQENVEPNFNGYRAFFQNAVDENEYQKLENYTETDEMYNELAIEIQNNQEKQIFIEAIPLAEQKTPTAYRGRPFLCSYEWLAHKFTKDDRFANEFVQACLAYVDTPDARVDNIYVDIDSAKVPSNSDIVPDTDNPSLDLQYFGNDEARERIKKIIRICQGYNHIVTKSVEFLVVGLMINKRLTIEFQRNENEDWHQRSIDVQELRAQITNGRYAGRIYPEDDKKQHCILTFITLLLIGSSSGIPMYASRGWKIISKAWFDIVQRDPKEGWLARWGEPFKRVEVSERRLLELIITVISIAHVSDEAVRAFRPNNIAYKQYVERFYKRLRTSEALGYVDSEPYVETKVNAQETKVNIPESKRQRYFPQRLRFVDEFSFPKDMKDILDAVRYRLSHWLLFKDISRVVFI